MSQTIRIFLASSAELKDDRERFERFIGRKNKTLHKHGRFIKLEIWEDFIDTMSRTRLQDEYNKAVRDSDIFVMLFFTKVGQFTREEFEAAFGKFKQSGKPLIYTWFKKAPVILDNIPRADIQSLWDFRDRLKELGHYCSEYEDSNDLENQFNRQLELLDPFSGGDHVPDQRDVVNKYWQQLIHDPDFNSMAVIGQRERQGLDKLYVRLQVTAHGDKTGVGERFLKRKKDELHTRRHFHTTCPPILPSIHFNVLSFLVHRAWAKQRCFDSSPTPLPDWDWVWPGPANSFWRKKQTRFHSICRSRSSRGTAVICSVA
jgi:hypothetical protein